VLAPLALTQLVTGDLLAAGGTVINVSSDAAVEPYPGWGGYGASKAALEHASRILAVERPDRRVLVVDPGDMRTEMHQLAFPEDISTGRNRRSVSPIERLGRAAAQRPLPGVPPDPGGGPMTTAPTALTPASRPTAHDPPGRARTSSCRRGWRPPSRPRPAAWPGTVRLLAAYQTAGARHVRRARPFLSLATCWWSTPGDAGRRGRRLRPAAGPGAHPPPAR
jgi:hypothetical protein